MVEHFYVKFSDPIAASVFEISCGETERHTDKRRRKLYLRHCRRRGYRKQGRNRTDNMQEAIWSWSNSLLWKHHIGISPGITHWRPPTMILKSTLTDHSEVTLEVISTL